MWMLLALGIMTAAYQPVQPCEPVIRIVEQSGSAIIEASCTSSSAEHHNAEFRYEMQVERSGESGTSRSSQAGAFTPGTPSADTLARTRVNVSAGDELHVRLSIFEGDRLLTSTEIRRELR